MASTPTARDQPASPSPPGLGRRAHRNTAGALARRFAGQTPHVVIAGGFCLLGRRLARYLLEGGWDVTIVDSPLPRSQMEGVPRLGPGALSVVWHDLAVPLHIDDHVHAVINLAALRAGIDEGDAGVVRAAERATEPTLELASRHNAVFVLASSSDVYGGCRQGGLHEDELGGSYRDATLGPRQKAYRVAEAQTTAAAHTHDMRARIARLFNVYGSLTDPGSDVVTTLLAQALRGSPLTVHGDGSQTRTFVYVDDAADALVRLLRPDLTLPGAVNIGGAEPTSIIALARMIRRLTGSASTVRRCPEPVGTIRHRHPDIGRASRYLAWRPRTPLAEGLAQAIHHTPAPEVVRAPAPVAARLSHQV